MIDELFTKLQALEGLQQLRDSPVAWRECATVLANNGMNLDDKTKFVCLQVYFLCDYGYCTQTMLIQMI